MSSQSSNNTSVDRRSFLKSAAVGSAALAFSARSWSAVNGANDDIRVAVVGFRSRGMSHVNGFKNLKGVRIAALCDVDQDVLEKGVQDFAKDGQQVTGYTDVRKLMEDKNIDVIATATPNHWHALITIWACQAGKDVYVEKPVSHNVLEGRRMVQAARKYGRIVQTGTQSRSNPGLIEAIQYLHDGELGKIKLARGLCYKPRQSIGNVAGGFKPAPRNVDYDLWTGPAPLKPLNRENLHYDWHWVSDTGNGDLGNQGIHQMDIARWALQVNELSPRVVSIGGRVGYTDDGNTPNTQVIYHLYDEAPLIFEVRGLPKDKASQKKWGGNTMPDYRGAKIGVVVDCENGSMVIPSYNSAIVYDNDGKEVKRFNGGADHFANFIKGVRSRRSCDLNADILEGHLSSALCHTGNISHHTGVHGSLDEIQEIANQNPFVAEAFDRMRSHLEANEVDLSKTPLTMGQFLEMDPQTERFTNSIEANRLLTREYRAPFVVPDRV
jgi:predicted dehydrogenase